MRSATLLASPLAVPSRAAPRSDLRSRRALLALLTVSAVALGFGLGPRASPIDPELARLLRYMALLKGLFALAAFAACWWRLARVAVAWRTIVYVAAPALMAGGAVSLWQLQAPWLAAIGLHAGLFALLAAALTDAAFIPFPRRRAG